MSYDLSKKEIIPIFSNEYVNHYFIFNFSNPSFFSAYLCNFFHAEMTHLIFVIIAFLFGIISISIIHFIESKQSIIEEKPKYLCLKLILLTYLILPILISLFSAIWGKMIGMNGCYGFSGIAYAFLGVFTAYLFKISYLIYTNTISHNYCKFSKMIFFLLPFLFIFCILLVILINDINSNINYPGHITGFSLGICFGYLFLELKF